MDLIAEAQRNWEASGWGESSAMAAATSITRAQQIVLSRVNDVLAPFQLTFSRFEALALLKMTKHGSLPLGKIGERLQVHPTSVTNTIDRLETDGFVERVPHPTDRRTTLAQLTDAGKVAVVDAQEALEEIRYGMGAFSESTVEGLVQDLAEFRQQAGDF